MNRADLSINSSRQNKEDSQLSGDIIIDKTL